MWVVCDSDSDSDSDSASVNGDEGLSGVGGVPTQ